MMARTVPEHAFRHNLVADAWPSWLLMMHDVTKQSWSEFGDTGSSAGAQDGHLQFIATFYRRQPPAASMPP